MGLISTLANKTTIGAFFNGSSGTPYNQEIIATSELTKGQKQFSTLSDRQNLPKPKTLFFTYFSLNPDLMTKTAIKKEVIKALSNPKNNSKTQQNNINNTLKNTVSKALNSFISSGLDSATANLLIKDNNKVNKYGETNKKFHGEIDELNADTIENVQTMKQLSFEISKMVKGYTKPKITFGVNEYNEYNRKRLCYDKTTYEDVTVTFFDVKENPVQRFFTTYLKFINNDFLCKGPKLWQSQVDISNWYDGDKGYSEHNYNINPFGFTTDSNFRLINKICFCEYYQDKMTVYTIENPIIKSIDWGESVLGDYKGNEIKVVFGYEGITNDMVDVVPYNTKFDWDDNVTYLKSMVNSSIRKNMAKFLQTRYTGSTLSTVLTDTVSFLKSVMNGETKINARSITNQVLDTASKIGYVDQVNSIAKTAQTIQAYKNSDDKLKLTANMASDPSSIFGKVLGKQSVYGGSGLLF